MRIRDQKVKMIVDDNNTGRLWHERRETIYDFVKQMCIEYNIDKSHDLEHAKDCVHFAEKLFQKQTHLENHKKDNDTQCVIFLSAALHDTIDSKYTKEFASRAVTQVQLFLESLPLRPDLIIAVLSIITTMSYSYLNKRRQVGLSFPDHGQWQHAYHIVRHADLLCSFRVKRCFQYQKHITPEIKNEDAMHSVRKLFQERVFAYKKNKWLTLEEAIELSVELEKLARIDLETFNYL